MTSPAIRLGQTYYCSVCGSEVTVIRSANGDLQPVCCKRPMRPKAGFLVVFHCPICGAEVMVLHGDPAQPHPRCCNVAMHVLSAA